MKPPNTDFTGWMPEPAAILAAHERIAPHVHRTPILTSRLINEQLESRIFFKCENFQKAGAFKSRGAVNAVFSIAEERLPYGVCTHSSGNHAQALARAAALRDIPAFIVMPENSPAVKVAAVKTYGGQITFCPPTLHDREETLARVKAATGATEVHPYNDRAVITGQATCAREIFEDMPEPPDFLIAPVGGGGLLSGTLVSTSIWSPGTKVLGAEPAGANDAFKSLKQGTLLPSENPLTIADGLLTSLGSNTWPIIQYFVSDILLADDTYIIKAMRLVWERLKIIAEPSAVVPLAVMLKMREQGGYAIFRNRSIALIVSGGNFDPDRIPWKP
jgi:threonine dehydratase